MNIMVTTPKDEQDRESVFRFLYGIWVTEFNRELPGTNHENEQIKDDLDRWANHFMALDDGGRIVGCVRFNQLSRGNPSQGFSDSMGFTDLAALFGPERVAFISHLAISSSHRGSTVISLLLAELFRSLFEQEMAVAACYCQLNLVNLYHRIGMRPYLPNFKQDGRMRVPLIGCINDRDYLEQTGSPLHLLLPAQHNDKGRAARLLKGQFAKFYSPDITPIKIRSLWAQLAHAAPDQEEEQVSKLFQGLPQASFEHLLEHLPRIRLSRDELLQVNQTSEATMGILVSGALGVGMGDEANPHFIYVIHPGEPFGELLILTRVRHPVILQSMEESEIVLLPKNLFDRFGEKDPPLALQLYKNLLTILARRLTRVHSTLAGLLGREEPLDSRVRRPALHRADAVKIATGREESYHFDTLSDKKQEFDRLTCQAKIAHSLEINALQKIGLSNGDQILDLGSGPGITTMLLARHFPDSRIIGVEPEEELRSSALSLGQQQNLDRCIFLEGTAQKIPLPDQGMDFSYARLLFQHIPDPMDCLREMKRVTRPGGIVCVLDVDDGTIFIHPEAPEWQRVEKRVAMAQARFGGDRHVGRKLLSYMQTTGFAQVQVDIVPVTTQMLGPKLFFDIVFGFKQQHLKRVNDWDLSTEKAFTRIGELLMKPGAFASENIFVAHATVPG
jgi:ubiquinone/menaquinone biosynthesis C-methylase UbiE/predicted GNAT family N-acyltransferase